MEFMRYVSIGIILIFLLLMQIYRDQEIAELRAKVEKAERKISTQNELIKQVCGVDFEQREKELFKGFGIRE